VVASRCGTSAVAACWLLLTPVTVLPFAVKLFRAIGLRYRDYFGVLLPALGGCAAMVAAVLAARTLLATGHAPASARLAIEVAVGGVAYLGFLWIFCRQTLDRYIRFLRSLRGGGSILTEAELQPPA